jgi:hypothetical protein
MQVAGTAMLSCAVFYTFGGRCPSCYHSQKLTASRTACLQHTCWLICDNCGAGLLCVGVIKQSRKRSIEERAKAEEELALLEKKREGLRQKLATLSRR